MVGSALVPGSYWMINKNLLDQAYIPEGINYEWKMSIMEENALNIHRDWIDRLVRKCWSVVCVSASLCVWMHSHAYTCDLCMCVSLATLQPNKDSRCESGCGALWPTAERLKNPGYIWNWVWLGRGGIGWSCKSPGAKWEQSSSPWRWRN